MVSTHLSYATEGTVRYDCTAPTDAANYDVDAFAPELIIHCAAMTHVDECERRPDDSLAQNVAATRAMAELAGRHRATLLYISTDYVFDGKSGPYAEGDEPSPISVYGQHKLEAEKVAQVMNHPPSRNDLCPTWWLSSRESPAERRLMMSASERAYAGAVGVASLGPTPRAPPSSSPRALGARVAGVSQRRRRARATRDECLRR